MATSIESSFDIRGFGEHLDCGAFYAEHVAAKALDEMIETRRLTLDDSRAFAALSGDFNTQHLDPVRARRFLFGASVIHGIHLVLVALDVVVAGNGSRSSLRSINVLFSSPAPTGDAVSFAIEERPENVTTLLVRLGGRIIITIDATWSGGGDAARPGIPDELFISSSSANRKIEDVKAYWSSVPLAVDRTTLRRLFPNLAANLPADQIAVLLAATRIVGMDCPGTNSIFATLNIEFETPPLDEPPMMDFEVTQTRPARNLCTIAIRAPGASGQINALFRPPLFEQPNVAPIRSRVPPGAFAAQRILIIGGSRGLGELAAKIAAVGGGETIITYMRGRDDALRVADDIITQGGSSSTLPYDATANGAALQPLRRSESSFTHIYYFATPRIEPNRTGKFDEAAFAKYCSYYVDGLNRLATRFLVGRSVPLAIFNPSTIYIDQPDARFAEYAAAKLDSERLCAQLQKSNPEVLKVFAPRLPRLRTDQTIGLHGSDAPLALETLLEVLPRSVVTGILPGS
jgi:acyl dehydratase